jgi:hypothetical protein
MVGATDMDFDIENKRYNFTVGEYLTTDNLFSASSGLTNVVEAIADLEVTDSVAGTFQITNDGSTWVTITDVTAITKFATSGTTLKLKYTAGGTGYLEHMGVLYNPKSVYSEATDVVLPTKNLIINGDFNVYSRGGSFAAAANNTWTLDRWIYKKSGTMVHTISRDTSDIPTETQSDHTSGEVLKMIATTGDAAIAADAYCSMQYRMEGFDVRPLLGNYGTLSFWVKATVTGTYTIAFRAATGSSYVAEYTITAADTWEKKTIVVNFNDTIGTWGIHSDVGLYLDFNVAVGSNYQTTADVWTAGTYLGTSSQVNGCASVDDAFRLSQVKLEVGQIVTPFVPRPFGEELALCQRYFCKSYERGVAPGAVTAVGQFYFLSNNHNSSTHAIYGHVALPVAMRDTPTLTTYSTDGTSGKVEVDSGNVTPTGTGVSESGFYLLGSDPVASTNRRLHFQWTVDAEL